MLPPCRFPVYFRKPLFSGIAQSVLHHATPPVITPPAHALVFPPFLLPPVSCASTSVCLLCAPLVINPLTHFWCPPCLTLPPKVVLSLGVLCCSCPYISLSFVLLPYPQATYPHPLTLLLTEQGYWRSRSTNGSRQPAAASTDVPFAATSCTCQIHFKTCACIFQLINKHDSPSMQQK